MARFRIVAFAALVSAALGVSLAGLATPANAATRYPAADTAVTSSVSQSVSPDTNNFVAVYETSPGSGVFVEFPYPCDSGNAWQNAYPKSYLSGVINNCEYRVWLEDNSSGTDNHCVNPGYVGYVPGGFHYPYGFLVGKETGKC